MKSKTWKSALGIFLLTAATGFWSQSCDEAENLFDCQSVCEKYKSCYNNNYDVGACREKCRMRSNTDRGFERKADACEACIDNRSCVVATFTCGATCAGIVP